MTRLSFGLISTSDATSAACESSAVAIVPLEPPTVARNIMMPFESVTVLPSRFGATAGAPSSVFASPADRVYW